VLSLPFEVLSLWRLSCWGFLAVLRYDISRFVTLQRAGLLSIGVLDAAVDGAFATGVVKQGAF
jgi:hypothetical protein